VCEVPGWGVQLSAERVAEEMQAVGLRATEAGPDGFLPFSLLRERDLRLVGGFVGVPLHLPGGYAAVQRAAERLAAESADVLVLAATAVKDDYDARPELDDAAWAALFEGLEDARALCDDRGLRCALHPHVGTVVERQEDVERVLTGSTVELCLDTGHLLVGGTDPVAIARAVPQRVAHVHLKDVDARLARRVAAGEVPYSDAVRAGLYRPLGRGAVDVAGLVGLLETRGYDGWYVLEQDVMLAAEPPAGAGPVKDVRASLEFLRGLLPDDDPSGPDNPGSGPSRQNPSGPDGT
jgi:inosose dehydratase